jgi:hypothetical protein
LPVVSSIARASGERRSEHAFRGGDDLGDADGVKRNAQIRGEHTGIVLAVLAGNGRGQADAGDILRAKGRRREDAHHGGIDAAAERDQALLEAALVRVVTHA